MLRLIEEEASSHDIRFEIERHSRPALAEHVCCTVHFEVLIYRLLLNNFHGSAVKKILNLLPLTQPLGWTFVLMELWSFRIFWKRDSDMAVQSAAN